MQIQTILLLILAAIVALLIVGFQYYYKSKKRGKHIVLLSFFRFIALFGVFLLLINPKFSKKEFFIEKTNLVILTDNSSSVKSSIADVKAVLSKLKSDDRINEKFNIKEYNFGNTLNSSDSLSFKEQNTNISSALSTVAGVFHSTNKVALLLTDGNQTVGQDYEFLSSKLNFPVYPIVLGDTTSFEDVRIEEVNANKYAFLKNKFPVEFYVAYEGQSSANSTVAISLDGKTVFKERMQLSSVNNSKKINIFLDANSVGLKNLKISVAALANEKNTINNTKNIVVEVVDEKTNVAIITNISHPDVGALKNSIETNEQRSVRVYDSNVDLRLLSETSIFVLYQPDTSFKAVFDYLNKNKASTFVVVGSNSDINFLNNSQENFSIETGYPMLDVVGVLNPAFSKYDISDFDSSNYPPLLSSSGSISFAGVSESLLSMNIRGVNLSNSLFSLSTNNESKTALLLGENIWKWRIQSYRNDSKFENFDKFIGKLFLYLSENKKKNRLNLEYQSIYEGIGKAKIAASYFDETFVFDTNASLILTINNKEIPMLLKNEYFEADLSYLKPGNYNFSVTVNKGTIKRGGKFTILDFDVEQQFLSSNYKKLEKVALATKSELIYPSGIIQLIDRLNSDNRYVPIQKSTENVVSLIDFRILLAIIIVALALEWFIRKYNGLI
ncbi:VWA domain-containing protein [Cellulophaga sp. HaHaR_3_176]|uniref:VWA domain-containing protein n=1 Tax=Cellulophaga sp. HaHaR_3_176 TaxID=1942464 RepID=UPI001C1FC444|nr:VWA domain-containing protein [Cellulophaga sp. HaHaR_3_176]QWX85339.1 VWA domain-containing protein [Cellulophaga sp. HaHaR_3_176]